MLIQTYHSVLVRNCKISKFKNAIIFSKTIFFSSKMEVQIFNMPATFVQSFRLIAEKLSEEFIIQTCLSVLVTNCKISKSKNAVILFKMTFLFKKEGAHLQYACNIYAKFEIDCLKTVGGVDDINFLSKCDGQTDG